MTVHAEFNIEDHVLNVSEFNGTTTGESVSVAGNTSQLSVEEYLESLMGEKRRDLASVSALTFVYVLIFITGMSGNVCTCIVIARNSYMHTATNYYLFSLAVSDTLTLLFGLPPELYGIWESYPWRLGEPFCIFKSFLAEMTWYASVLTITAFTVERYVAICHPIKAQTLSNLSRAFKIVCAIWIFSSLFALPYPVHTRLFPYVVLNGTAIMDSLQCNVPFEWQPKMRYAFQISTFVFFIFPMALITIMYALIGMRLNKSDFNCTVTAQKKHITKTKARKAVIHMLVAVVVAFFVQWAPFHAQRLMTSYVPLEMWTPTLIRFQSDLFYVSGVLYFCNSTVNPILYNVMSKKFRVAFKRTLCRCCYSPEELQELIGKSKSVYCSDRTSTHGARQPGHTHSSKLSFSDHNTSKNGSMLLKPGSSKELHYLNGGLNLSPRGRVHQSLSTGRLNDFFSDIEHAQLERRFGSSQRDMRPGFSLSQQGSVSSFLEPDTGSAIELKSFKSLTSAYSANHFQQTRIVIPGMGGRNIRGSFV